MSMDGIIAPTIGLRFVRRPAARDLAAKAFAGLFAAPIPDRFILQQAWQDQGNGAIIWRDVPIADEAQTADGDG